MRGPSLRRQSQDLSTPLPHVSPGDDAVTRFELRRVKQGPVAVKCRHTLKIARVEGGNLVIVLARSTLVRRRPQQQLPTRNAHGRTRRLSSWPWVMRYAGVSRSTLALGATSGGGGVAEGAAFPAYATGGSVLSRHGTERP